jgi:uncharacterized protein YkwD
MRSSVHILRRGARSLAALSAAAALLALAAAAPARATAGDCPGADAVPSAAGLAVAAEATICLANGERAVRGRAGLVESPALGDAARAYAARMVAQRFFAHVAPDGSSLVDRIARSGWLPPTPEWFVGENLAWARIATPRTIVAAWMGSPSHRRNLLSRAFEEVGIGIVLGVPMDGGAGATYTAEFGRAGDAPEPPLRCGAPGARAWARCWCRAPGAGAARGPFPAIGRAALCGAGFARARQS